MSDTSAVSTLRLESLTPDTFTAGLALKRGPSKPSKGFRMSGAEKGPVHYLLAAIGGGGAVSRCLFLDLIGFDSPEFW